MQIRLVAALAAVIVLMPAGCKKEALESTSSTACDRDCILQVTKTYLTALVAHDPGAAPLAENVAFIENITRMKPGEGLWQSALSGPSSFAIYVPDEKNQAAGFLGMMTCMAEPPADPGAPAKKAAAPVKKSEQPVLVALRLKLEGGKITEAEHLLALITGDMETLRTPRPGLLAEVPAAERMDHAELIRIGASYYDALDDNDGTLMPFADDCERHENGMITAGANAGAGPNSAGTGKVARDCAGQLTSQVMSYIGPIEHRRVFAADPVTGLVMGLSHFRHPMDTPRYEVINTDGTKAMFEMKFEPFDLPAAHIYKIGGDRKVHEIEASGFMAPYNSPTGWE